MRWFAAAAVALAGAPSALQGQAVAAGVVEQRYTFGDADRAGVSSIALTLAPARATLPIGSWLSVDVAGVFGRIVLSRPDGSRSELSGPADVDWGVRVGGPALSLRVGGSVPAGEALLSLDEASIVALLNGELLPFAIHRWRDGGSLGAEASGSASVGPVRLSASLGRVHPLAELELGTDEMTYRPGDQSHGAAAVELTLRNAASLSVRVGMQLFEEDALDGTNFFRAGERQEAVLSYAFPLGLRSGGLLFGSLRRVAGGREQLKEPSGREEAAADQRLRLLFPGLAGTSEQRVVSGGAKLRLAAGRAALLPEAMLRSVHAPSGDGGWLAAAGVELEWRAAGGRMGPRLLLVPSARYRAGRIETARGLHVGVRGWEAGLSARLETGP